MYTAGQQQMHYLPQYYSTPYAQYAPSSYPERTLKAERRRPKYTRSKTGCLTCRKKKVKVCTEFSPRPSNASSQAAFVRRSNTVGTNTAAYCVLFYSTNMEITDLMCPLQCDETKPTCQRCCSSQLEVSTLFSVDFVDSSPGIHFILLDSLARASRRL